MIDHSALSLAAANTRLCVLWICEHRYGIKNNDVIAPPRSCMPGALPLRCLGNGYGDAESSDLCERTRVVHLRVHAYAFKRIASIRFHLNGKFISTLSPARMQSHANACVLKSYLFVKQ